MTANKLKQHEDNRPHQQQLFSAIGIAPPVPTPGFPHNNRPGITADAGLILKLQAKVAVLYTDYTTQLHLGKSRKFFVKKLLSFLLSFVTRKCKICDNFAQLSAFKVLIQHINPNRKFEDSVYTSRTRTRTIVFVSFAVDQLLKLISMRIYNNVDSRTYRVAPKIAPFLYALTTKY